MPLYEYECTSCGRRTEALQRADDPPVAICPHCGGPLRKLFSAPAVHFKGSGWYVTDYARKGSARGTEEGGGGKDAGKDASTGGADKGTSPATGAADKPAKEAGGGGSSSASTPAKSTPAKKDTPAG